MELSEEKFRRISDRLYVKDDIGSGLFARVFERRNPTRVIKVATADAAYQKYLSYCAASPSKHNPVVYAVHTCGVDTIVIMERLEPLDGTVWHDILCREFFDWTENDLDVEWLMSKLALRYNQAWVDENEARIRAIGTPSFRDRVRELQSDDLHSGNVMRRSSGTFVITDPWATTGLTTPEC
jgi:hypothetical protein